MKHNCRTTHYACDCFLERMGLLEKVAKCAEMLIEQLKFQPDPIVDLALAGNLRNALEVLRKKEPNA